MNLSALSPDFIGGFVGFILTVLVLSYLFGDNAMFRFTSHLFIGVAAGFVAVVVFYNVILNQLVFPTIQNPGSTNAILPAFFLGLWLFITKVSPRLSRFGNPLMGYLVGAAAATAIGGAVFGTVFPQVGASGGLFDTQAAGQENQNLIYWLVRGVLILIGTITTLAFFHFGTRPRPDQLARPPAWIEGLGKAGQIFIMITFGVLFAGVYSAALTALIERLNTLFILLGPYLLPQ
ncbi:MAG: hypothetical protein EHM70_08515 [Chloroflexota bacterium]|nr:MAG: hypothetical protein EHM70_08515 [Chloroflexota bacterium]